jgi:glycosyltransferase involved in cell wall biosynthesis
VATPEYSIIIPAYNESERIRSGLDQVLEHVAREGWNAEIIVVDDGSRDQTAAIVREYAAQHPSVRLVENPGNRGKGYSVRRGMMAATGETLLFTDADLSAPIWQAEKLFDAIRRGADQAIGSRWIETSPKNGKQPFHRRIASRLFKVLPRVVLGLHYKDTQCGFKAYSRRAAEQIFPQQTIERWGFDPEILFLAQKMGLETREVPVEWAHDPRSKIHPVRDGLRMFGDIVKIRWNDLTGRYSGGPPSPEPGTKVRSRPAASERPAAAPVND